MKEINKPSSALIAEARAAKEYAWDYINEHIEEVQTSLEYRGVLSESSVFDQNDELASNVFAGAIMYASEVFGNRIVFGGGNYRIEDKTKILDHLKAILEILRNPNK